MAEMFNPQNPEILELSRQRKMADLLTSRGMETPQAQTVAGGVYVPPNPMEYLAKLFSTYAGTKANEKLDAKEVALAQKLRELGVTETQDILGIAQGKPEISTELAGPAYRGVAPTAVMPAVAGNPQEAMAKALMAQSPQAQRLVDPLLKMAMPEPTTLEREWKAAKTQGYKGTINDFKNQMTEAQKAENAISRERLGIARQELAFNTGIGMPTGGGQQAPMQTINPGSPILAPNQQIPQQMGMPNLSPKALQDINIATAKEKNKLQVEAQAALPTALNTVNSGLKAIQGMIGDTTVDAKGNLVYGKTKPHPGFNDAVGFPSVSSGFGATSFIKGSDWKNFEARFKEIEGKSFLAAIDSLRGTGAISETEGAKATSAINRMSLSQSPAEFVEAANELKTVMANGYSAAQQKAGAKQFNPNTQPSIPGVKLRYNLQTGEWN